MSAIIPLIAIAGIGVSLALTPLIVVPGTGGSVLETRYSKATVPQPWCPKTSDWQLLWLDYTQWAPNKIDCWVDNMKLQYDPAADRFKNNPGVEVRIKGTFGTFEALEEFSPGIPQTAYLKDLVVFLESKGYKRGKSLFGAAYDFRYAPNPAFYKNLQNLIQSAYIANGGSKVALLSHSMGSIFVWKFLNSVDLAWKQKYVANWISVVGALGGSSLTLRGLASGNVPNPLLNPAIFREQQRATESNYILLPNPVTFKDKVLVSTPSKNYTANNLEDFLTDAGVGKYLPAYKRLARQTKALKSPQVPMFCFYASGIDTPDSYTYSTNSFDSQPTVTTAPGDGTLSTAALKMCETIASGQPSTLFRGSYTVEGTEHTYVVRDTRFLNKLYEVLSAGSPA